MTRTTMTGDRRRTVPLGEGLRAVFFDVGGPLYHDDNFLRAITTALGEIRSERGQPHPSPGSVQMVYDRVRTAQQGSLRTELARDLLGGPDDRSVLDRRLRRHWVHPRGSLFPDVASCLAALKGRYTLGILANQEVDVVDAIHRDGLAGYFDVWAVSAIVGLEKPDPALFEWALRRAGVPAGAALHVGNRLDTDVRPAKALGMRTVWLLRGEAPDRPTPEQCGEPDAVIASLDELPGLLLNGHTGRLPGDPTARIA